jgi:lipopolysaccharide export LptBFGC system permease protein LptF
VIGYGIIQIAGLVIARSFSINPEKIFKEFIADPIPDNVKNIRGGGVSWLDFYANLSFKTDHNTFNEIVRDYEIIPRQIIHGQYFSKNIMKDPDSSFYYKKGITVDKQNYDYLVVWNKRNNTAYFSISQAVAVSMEEKQVYENFYLHVKKTYSQSTEETKKQLKNDIKSGKLPWYIDIEVIRERYGEPDLIRTFEKNNKIYYMLFYDNISLDFTDNKLVSRGESH